MADPRFHRNLGPFTLAELARAAGAELSEGADPEKQITDIAPLDQAGPDDLSFIDNVAYLEQFKLTEAGACIAAPAHAGLAPEATALLITSQPYLGFARVAQKFYPQDSTPEPGISAAATVDPGARLGEGCRVEAGAVIAAGVQIGNRCLIGAQAVIGEGVIVGDDCRIGSHVSLSHCLIGARVTVHPGARIGQDGFGFALDPGGFVKVPQVGRVVVEDDCDIGANTTIDRGSGPDTVIGQGTWIDNQVQVGHNVQIGRNSILVAQVGISGSTRIGNGVALGGKVGIAGHLNIGDGAQVAAGSGVIGDVPAGETWFGYPARPRAQMLRQLATLARLSKGKRGEKS